MKLWARWRQFAHSAAVVQSNVLLFVLYFALLVPLSFVLRVTTRPRRPARGWQPIPSPADERRSSHEQF